MNEVDEGGSEGGAPVRVLHVDDPVAVAAAQAEELQADLASDLTSAERHVRARVDAGRRALIPAGADDEHLLPRAEEIRTAARIEPVISDADVAEFERLAAGLARAARIRTRTEARFTENLQAKLAASAGVALHPGAIKEAGTAVVAAEEALASAERALVDHGPRPLPGAEREVVEPTPHWGGADAAEEAPGPASELEDPVLRQPIDDFDEVALDRRRAVTRGAAVFLVLVGLGVIALGLEQPPVITAVLAAAGVVLGIAIAVKGRRDASVLAGDKAHSAAILANLPETTGARFPGSGPSEPVVEPEPEPEPEPVITPLPVDEPAVDPWLDERVALDAARDEAEELVRTTRRRWHQLAGIDADPYDTDAVVRAHDPQLAFDARVADASPTVRTVAAFHRKAQARWRVLWNAIGHDDPPEPEDLDAKLEELLGDHRRRQADLARLEAAEGRAAAELEARTPLVLVEPSAWMSPGRLAQLLSSVPPQGDVVVVERTTTS